jgi:pyruvate/2-oxoglutarate dehydrogenase complex dihydrolipoamide acyltransferase (E2) component
VSSSSTETLVDVTMPQMGVSVAEGTVVEWKKQPGDWVQADEIIASISTDKIDTDVEAPATGRVQELIVEVGATVEVGTVLARIATDAKPGEAHRSENAESAGADSGADSADAAERGEPTSEPARRSDGPRRYSPVVMRIASEHGVDLDQVEGTGRGGRVRKQDVLAFIENGGAAAEPAEAPMHIESPYRPDEPAPPKTRKPRFEAPPAPEPAPAAAGSAPLSRMRQAIGARMLQSLQTSATCTTVVEADLIRIEAARKQTGFTYLPYIARATIEALREFPQLNATLEDDTLTTYDGVHLGIAVSLGEGGLIVPVIRDAQELSVEGLAKRIKDLAVRARNNQLQPDEVRGGSFTITNPGGYGSIIATPVINQPQVAILDTEAVVKRPVVITDELGNDSIAIRPMTYLCMSWDHRALDGALAAQFLTGLRKKLESWPTT